MTNNRSIYFFSGLLALLMLPACNFKHVVNNIYARYIVRAPYDVIIVPGIGFDTATQQTNGFNARVVWAKTLYDRGVAKNIIFSGSACYSPYIEGKVMKMIAEKIGVPPANVFCETKAQHGKENVYYSLLMARKMGFRKVALATDPYQALYLKAFVEKNMPDMGILPIAIDSLKYFSRAVPFVDASSAMVKDFIPLSKRQSWFSRFEQANSNRLPALPKDE